MKEKGQIYLFDDYDEMVVWKEHWQDMPEYNYDKNEPEIEATFKFRSKDDFDLFHKIIKEQIYDGERVFDGNQQKERKSTWFPLEERPSNYIYRYEP